MPLFWDAAPRIPSNTLRLQAGQSFVPPTGWYIYKPGRASCLQRYDAISQVWRFYGDDGQDERIVYFDGVTTRLSNPTGCAVGAIVTTAGSGYTSAPAVTASAGASTWQAIVGGVISTAAVISVAGSGYQYPPILWIESPPNIGVQATGYTTIANGTISAVTIDAQGAGYTYPPNVEVLNDPRDTVGGGGQVVLSLAGSGTVAAVICTNMGNPITSGTVPTLSFSGGGGSSAAATVIMDWTIQSVSITAAGAGYTAAAGAVTATGAGGSVTTAPAYLGTETAANLSRWRAGSVQMTTNASGGMSAVASIIDPGRYSAIPTPAIIAAQNYSTVGTLTFVMGGSNTTVYLQPMQI